MSRPDWHGLVGVTRSLHAAICRAHRLHGPDAQSRAARMIRTAISPRSATTGVRDFMTSIRPTVSPTHRVTWALKAISPGARDR
jgi:hypothetical protein